MPRPLSSSNASAIQATVVDVRYLIEIGLIAETLYFSTRETVAHQSKGYIGGDILYSQRGDDCYISMDDETPGAAEILNEPDALVTVKMLFGDATTVLGDDVVFSGRVLTMSWDRSRIILECGRANTRYVPDMRIGEDTGFTHLLRDGTKLRTTLGVVVMRSR